MNPRDGKSEEKNFEKIRALHLEIIKDPKAPHTVYQGKRISNIGLEAD